MIRFIITFLLGLLCFTASAQTGPPLWMRSDDALTQGDPYVAITKAISIPYGPTPSFNGGLQRPGSLYFSVTDSSLYYYNAQIWTRVSKSNDLSGYYTKDEVDILFEEYYTISQINAALNDKVDKATTINGKALSGNITLTANDVGAYSKSETDGLLSGKFNNPTGTLLQYITGTGSLATFPDIPQGTVTSVGVTMPTGFSVSNSPIVSSGNIGITYTAGYQGYTTTEANKLLGIQAGATANQTDAYLINRANHTGSQAISTITNLQTTLDGKQATITGAATTITGSNLTANRVLLSTAGGKVGVSTVTNTEVGYLTGVTSNIQTQLNNKVNTSTTFTNTGGIDIGGSLSTGNVSLGLNETYLNNRYLRKDQNDGNSTYTLTLGKLISGEATISDLILPSLVSDTSSQYLVVNSSGEVGRRSLDPWGLDIANTGGIVQFPLGPNSNQLRFAATGDASVSFNPATNTITYNSIPGSGSGGVVTSVFGRQGSVVPELGDYSTTLVTEGDNLYHTPARVRATPLTGLSITNSAIVAGDNILQALGKTQGQINNRALSSRLLTVSGTSGRIIVSGAAQDLTADREWIIDLMASGITPGTYIKTTVDTYGRVTAGASLVAGDIPNLAASKITSGTFATARLGTGTASAGTYVDGATGAWTSLPTTDLSGYYTKTETNALLGNKQDNLVSGTNIKTINGTTILGAGNIVTPNTEYTAGSGLTLSGTAFSLPITVSGSGTYVQSVVQTANGLTVTLGTPPNTTYSNMGLAELNTGTVTTARTISAKNLNDWLIGKNYLTTVGWDDITDRPSVFPPSAHTHNASDIDAGTLAIARIPTGTTGSTVALGNHTHTFASITTKPTTLSGYGITDAYTQTQVNTLLSGKFDVPTGTVNQYLDGTGEPVNFPTIPAQFNPTAGTGIGITGTYPNLTITNTSPNATHTGDVTGSTALTIANNAVTWAKIQNIATGSFLGRVTAGTGNIEVLTPAQVRTGLGLHAVATSGDYDDLSNKPTIAAQLNPTAGTGISITGTYPNLTFTNSSPNATHTGDVTGSTALTIANAAVTYAKIQNLVGLSVIGRSANSTGVSAAITAGTDGHVLRRSGTTLGFGTIGNASIADLAWGKLTGVPTSFTPSAHTHNANDINAGTLAIARIPTGTTGSTVALGNHTHTFASITSKPTTIAGYGITDAYTKSEVDGLIPTALTASNGIQITSGNITPVYGTAANTIAQGNDNRINNGQTAFEWGNHTSAGYMPRNTVVWGSGGAPEEWDDFTNNTFVRSTSAGNSPFSTGGTAINLRYNSNQSAQLFIGTTGNVLQFRASPSSVWSPVRTVWHDGNLSPVNTTTNQTEIAGNKSWTGTHFITPSDNSTLSGIPANTIKIYRHNNGAAIALTDANHDPEVNDPGLAIRSYTTTAGYQITLRDGGILTGPNGVVRFQNLSGTGNALAGLTSTGQLTRTELGDLGFVPYTGASSAVNLNAQNLTNVGTFRAAVTQIPTNTVEVAEKNRSYYLITNTNGAPVAKWETERWTGTSFGSSNGFGFGHLALQNNTGGNSSGFGYQALQSNTGANSNGFGALALQNNTGGNSSGFGYQALQNNTGGNSIGFGYQALRYNNGLHNSAFGHIVLYDDPGATVRNNITAIGVNIPWSAITKDYQTVFSGREIIGLDLTNARINSAAGNALVTKDWVGAQIGNGTLTLATGTGLQGSASFSANQSGNATFTVAAASGYAIPTTTKQDEWDAKQVALVSGTNIKTINGTTILGSGNIVTPNTTYTGSASITLSGTSFQRAALTGDVTAAANSNATTIANSVITNAKLANVPTGTIKGRILSGTGVVTDLTPSDVRGLLNVADGATSNQSDAYLLNRANHTGSQAISTITGLQTALDAKQATLVSGTNIKTINGTTILGSGNIVTDNTTYTAGNGLTLTGTVFSLPVTVSGTGTYVQSITQTANGITATLGTPPNTTYSLMTAAELNTGTATTARTISAERLTTWLGNKALLLSGGTVTGQIKRNEDAVAGDDLPRLSQVQSLISAGNAATATTLQTARTINGTSFNGSANITTTTWGTARNISIGGTSKSVNGSANVTWATSEIAAQTAVTLATARNISITGDATWSVSFNGSTNASAALTLANSGVSAGTYNNVGTQVRPFTVDAKGRVTSIGTPVNITPSWSSITSKPTTLSGYGVSDAYTKTEVDNKFDDLPLAYGSTFYITSATTIDWQNDIAPDEFGVPSGKTWAALYGNSAFFLRLWDDNGTWRDQSNLVEVTFSGQDISTVVFGAVTGNTRISITGKGGGAPVGLFVNKGYWVTGTYKPGDYVIYTSSADTNYTSLYFLKGSEEFNSSLNPISDVAHWTELKSLPGPQGIQGETGLTGDTGPAGPGVPTGGTAGQILIKSSGVDYDTEWVSLGTWRGVQIETFNTTHVVPATNYNYVLLANVTSWASLKFDLNTNWASFPVGAFWRVTYTGSSNFTGETPLGTTRTNFTVIGTPSANATAHTWIKISSTELLIIR